MTNGWSRTRVTGTRVPWAGRALVLGLACVAMAGCRHKPTATAITLPPPQQLPVDTTAKVEHQPVMAPVPVPAAPLTSVTVPVKKAKRLRKQVATAPAAPPAATAPVQVASAGPLPEANVIGALTPGGSETEQQQRDAQDLIAVLERRMANLSADLKKRQKEQILRVKSFEREAQAALSAGDSQGAWTLATKAKLLLDDLVR